MKASPASTRRQLENGVGVKENQTILKQKNAERCGKTESITAFRAKHTRMMIIQDTYVKSISVSSWLCRSYVIPIKNLSKKKQICYKRTLILKRVTRVHIFFLDCSTIPNNSEKDDIFIERTTRPRSTPQPLSTKTTSNSLRTRLTNTRKKFSEGKIDFDGNLNYTELTKLIRIPVR